MITEGNNMNCDECKCYNWYYDYCRKWNSKVDAREVHNCYEKMDTPVSDAMKNMSQFKAG